MFGDVLTTSKLIATKLFWTCSTQPSSHLAPPTKNLKRQLTSWKARVTAAKTPSIRAAMYIKLSSSVYLGKDKPHNQVSKEHNSHSLCHWEKRESTSPQKRAERELPAGLNCVMSRICSTTGCCYRLIPVTIKSRVSSAGWPNLIQPSENRPWPIWSSLLLP